ncbi:MAG TPA: hypothetical protein VGF61_08135 [Candidatus Acidoferrum sp.]
MTLRPQPWPLRRILTILAAAGLACAAPLFFHAAASDNPKMGDAVGAIDGESISVEGPMSVEVLQGKVKTILRSGSDVRVKAGQARIDLVEGGSITICGPAHFSVLKAGGSLTIALDTGTIHTHLENDLPLIVYTAQIQAHPISIGNSPEDTLVGLDASGAMCVRANKGAVRLEQQLTGQSVMIPQSGDVSLTNGQLESLHTSTSHCVCDTTQPLQPPSTEVSRLATPEELKKKPAEKKPAPPSADPPPKPEKQEPIYQVFMPPLHYDASAKVQEDFDPNLIVLVRRVRVRPTLIFQGKVEGDPIIAQVTPPPAAPAKPSATQAKPADDSTWNRVRTFFKKIWSPSS